MQDFPKDSEIVVDYTEVELAAMLANKLGDLDDVEITSDGVKEIFSEMAGIDGLLNYFKDTMAKDIKRYFSVPDGPIGDHDRAIIRGAFSRTAFLRAQCLDKLSRK